MKRDLGCWFGVAGLVTVLFLCCLSVGCGRSKPAPRSVPRSTHLVVSFEWTAENRCSDRSPEIVVEGIPPGTARLDVTMTDMDQKSFPHGGGSVECKRQGRMVIPAGALRDYQGPCPPGSVHRYRIVVSCVNEKGHLGASGEATQACCVQFGD